MYCSISCSRAWRSPSSWYRRRRTLSLSGTRPPLGQPDAVPGDAYVVDGGLEHASHAELVSGVAPQGLEQPPVERPDNRLERVVVHRQPDGQLGVAGRRPCSRVEQRAKGDLEILEMLEGQVESRRESREHEMRDAFELRLTWQCEGDRISHRATSTRLRGRVRGALPPPSPRRPRRASFVASSGTTSRARSRPRGRRASAPAA